MVIKTEKAQKAQIEKELMPTAWHPSRYWIDVFLRMRKKRQKKCGSRPSDMLNLKMY